MVTGAAGVVTGAAGVDTDAAGSVVTTTGVVAATAGAAAVVVTTGITTAGVVEGATADCESPSPVLATALSVLPLVSTPAVVAVELGAVPYRWKLSK